MDSEYIWDMVFDLVSAAFYIIAVTLLINITGLTKEITANVYDAVYDTAVFWPGENDGRENVISYDELCGALSGEIKYDVKIVVGDTELVLTAEEYKYRSLDMDELPKKQYYLRTYEYGDAGEIKAVVYTGK